MNFRQELILVLIIHDIRISEFMFKPLCDENSDYQRPEFKPAWHA